MEPKQPGPTVLPKAFPCQERNHVGNRYEIKICGSRVRYKRYSSNDIHRRLTSAQSLLKCIQIAKQIPITAPKGPRKLERPQKANNCH